MIMIVTFGLDNGITGMVVLNVTDTKQIGTTFTSNGEVLLTLDEIPSSITLTGEHNGTVQVLINGEEFYSGSGETQFAETKEVAGLGAELTITVEVENSTLTLDSLDYTYPQETSEPIPVWNSSVTEFSIMQGETLEIDLEEYFVDDDNLTYLATGASNITVEIDDSVLRVIPDEWFVGERRIKAIASDEYNVVEQQIKIIVTAAEENITIPENLTQPEENITINITPELNISENLTINITGNLTINETLNVTTNITANITTNLTMNITFGNITGLRFAIDEKIVVANKTLGKKIQDEADYEVYFQNITLTNESLSLEFFHDYNIPLPVFIEGNVAYNLSSATAQPNETVKIIVQLNEGILPRFVLHAGITSEVFEFGKNIPIVNTKIKKAKQMKEMTRAGTKKEVLGEMKQIHKKDKGKEKGQDKEEYWLIDRNDEKLDIELVSETAKARIIGTNASQIRTAMDTVSEGIIKTEVFAAEPTEMEEAVITLRKTGRVTAIVECTDINVETLSCPSGWKKANIPFTDDGENITFTVTHFSGYAGAEITVLNVQSYPILYGNWTVMFNTTGTANLTVTAVEGTTWSLDGDGTQLQFLDVKCGETVLNYTWVDNSVFIEDYNCSTTGYLTSKELQAGKHALKFTFGNDTAYAYNDVYFGKWWFRELNIRTAPTLNSSDTALGVATDSNRNIILTGYTDEGGDSEKTFTVKYDEGGTQVWNATYNRTPSVIPSQGNAIVTDTNDNVFVGGHTATSYPICVVIKYNSAGAHQWNVTYNSTGASYITTCQGLAIDTSNNVTVAAHNTTLATSMTSIILVKYNNSNGAQLWNTSWRTGTWQYIWEYGAATDNNNNIYVAGSWNLSKPFLVKFNSTGAYQWLRIVNISGRNGQANAVATDSENNAIIGGYVYAPPSSTTDVNYLIAKYNENGTELWNSTSINMTIADYGYGIATDLEDNIILTGTTDGNNYNMTTFKLNKTGTQIWNTTYGYFTGDTDNGRAVAIDNKNNIIVAGFISNGTRSNMKENYAVWKYYFDIPANSTRPILNSTDRTNRTSQNLTVYPQNVADTLDLDSVTNITNWYKNGKSITVLNMPFDINTNNMTNRSEKDFSPYSNNGSVVGALWVNNSLGLSGGAYSFDGNDYIDVNASATFDVRNLTIEAWVYSTNFEQNMFIFEKGSVNTQYALFFEGTNVCFRTFNQAGAGDNLYLDTSDIGVTNSAWHYMVATYNGTEKNIYVDGAKKTPEVYTEVLKTGLGTAERIGAYGGSGPSYYFNGKIDEVRVYDIALSDAQILANNQSGAPKYNRIASSELVKGDVWHAEVTPVDGRFAGTPLMSNGVKIGTKPRMNVTILNSTDNTNRTSQNLTVYYLNATDIDNDALQNVTNWYENGKSITVLNMPFEAKKGIHEEGTNEVGIWYFENNTKDFSGNANNGSCTNCPISETAGKVGMMYHFDGTNDAIRIPYNPQLSMVGKDFTIASWIYMDAEPDDWLGSIFSKSTGASTATNGYAFSIRGSSDGTNKNKLWADIMNAGSISESPGNTVLTANKWYHAAMTYDYDTKIVTYYLNGQPDGGFTSGVDVTDSGATSITEIGRGIDADGYAFNGKIDEVHVFNRSLNPLEVNAIYKKGLDQAADTIDFSGYNNNGNVTGATWTSSGIKGGAYNFDGSNNRINLTITQLTGATAFSVEMWVKPDVLPVTNYPGLFGRGDDNQRTPWIYQENANNYTMIHFETESGAGDGNVKSANLTQGAWNFLAFTWNGSIVTSYVNGVPGYTDTTTGRTLATSNGDTQIGWMPGYQYFDGTIDEVRVYDRALSAQQILADNASGAPRYDKTASQELSRGDVWNTNVIPLDTVEDGYAGMSNGVKIGTKPTVNAVILNSTDLTNRTSKNLTVYYNNVTDSDNDTVQNITNWYENGKSIAVLNMPFEGKTGMHTATTDEAGAWYFENNTKDMSQNENDGSCANCPTYVTSGRVGGAYDFDDAQKNVIIIPDSASLDITNNITIAFWVNRDDTTAWQRLITKSDYSGAWVALSYYVDFDDGNHIRMYANISGDSNNYYATGATALSTNKWYHVVAQYTGSQLQIYINGQLDGTDTASGSITANNLPLVIGADDSEGNTGFDGKIDEVHIFNRSLSLPEIKALYKNGLDKVNDTIDYSGYENNGKVNGATWTSSGVKGGAYDFDGSSNFVNIPDSGSVEITNKVTISYWVKGTFDYSASEGMVLDKGGWSTGEYAMTYFASNNPSFQIYDLSPQSIVAVTATNNGAWHNVVGTWNGTNISIYVDGVIENSALTTGTFVPDAENLYIGARLGTSKFFDGIIDEIQIYDRALTPQQILANYQSGAPKYDKTVSQELSLGEVWNSEVISTDGWEDGYGMSNGVQIGTAPTQNTPILNSTYTTNTTNENITVYPNGGVDIDGDAIRNITNWYKNGTSLTLLNMPFEGKISRHTPTTDEGGAWYFENNTKDMSRNENEGYCTNCPVYVAPGVVGGYYNFVGAGESITVPDSPSLRLGTNQTIAVWASYDTLITTYAPLVSKGGPTNNLNYGLYLEVDGDMWYGMANSVGSTCTAYENGGAGSKANIGLSTGWHHFVATYNGTTAKLYKDGTEVYSNDCTITPGTSSDPLIIGYPGFLESMNHMLDELHLFNRTLSAAEIKNMYTKGRNHTNYAIDYSGYGNDGTVTGAVFNATGGYDGRGVYMFDGADDYINVDPSNPTHTSNLDKIYPEFTFAAWINPRTSTFGQSLQQSIAAKMAAGGARGWKIMRNNITNGINFTFYNTSAGTESSINSTIGVPNSTWTHIAFVFKANDYQQIYINGVLSANGTTLNQLNGNTTSSGLLKIGDRDIYPDEQRFNGTIDEVLIFNSSLSASQILALYQNRTDLIHSAETEINDIFFAEVIPTDGIMDGLSARSNNLTILTIPPNTTRVILNSTAGNWANSTHNLTCYANITDTENTSVVAHYTWFNNSVEMTTLSGSTAITAGTISLVSTLPHTNTTIGDNWTCSVRAWDGYSNETDWNNASMQISPECGDTLTENKTHVLARDVYTTGNCFTVSSKKNVTLDCKGYAIRGDRTGSTDYAIYSASLAGNFTLKNCVIYNFSHSVYSAFSTSYFYNNTFFSPTYAGIHIASGNVNNVTSNNFTSCSPTGGSTYYAFYIQNGNDHNIVNNYFYNSTGYDIYLSGSAYRNRFINNTIDVANRNKTTINIGVTDSYSYFENNSITRQGTGTSSWGLTSTGVNMGTFFVGNNSVDGENLSDVYRYNINGLVFTNTTKGRANVYSFGQLVIYNSSNISITNSVFRNHTTYAVNLYNVLNVTIRNNSIADTVSTGWDIYAYNAYNTRIENNTLINSTAPIFINGVNNMTIINNTINGTGHAINGQSNANTDINLVIENNQITGIGGTGVLFSISTTLTNISVKHNRITAVYGGIQVSGTGVVNATIYNNSIIRVSNTGITTSGAKITNISFNTINCTSGTNYGMNLGVNSNTVVNNTVSHCQQGLYIASSYNNITNNVMFNNTYYGIVIASAITSYIRNNITHDNRINGYEPYFYYTPGADVVIENLSLKISNGVNTGVVTVVDAARLVFRNNTIRGNGSAADTGLAPGLGLGNITNSFIEGNMINSSTSSIDIYSLYSASPKLVFNNNTIANNTFLNTTTYSIYFRGGGVNNTIINNTFKYGSSYAVSSTVNSDSLSDYMRITQNRIYNHTNIVTLGSNKYTDIDFNDAVNITTGSSGIYLASTEYVTVHDNNLTGSMASAMIYMDGTARNNSITSNYINGSVNGIRWSSPYANNSAINNRIYGSTTVALSVTLASTAENYATQNIYNNTVCYSVAAITFGGGGNFNITKTHNNTFCIKNIYPLNGTTITGSRFNISFNATNVFNTTNTNCTLVLDANNSYGYNSTTQNNFNTTVQMSAAFDSYGLHNLTVNCTDPQDNQDLFNMIFFTTQSPNSAANISNVFVNSTYGTNFTEENITCWVNATDVDGNSPLQVYYQWYNNSIRIPVLSGNASVTANTTTAVSRIISPNTTINEEWKCEVKANDYTVNETNWHNSTNSLPVLGCGNLGSSLTLEESRVANATCFTMTADNIRLHCNRYMITGNLTGNAYAIDIPSGRTGVTIENCYIRNFSTGIYTNVVTNITFTNNTLANGTIGVYITTSSNNITFTNNTIANMSNTGIISNANNNTITNSRIFNCTQRGIALGNSDNTVIGGTINGSGHAGIATQGNNNVFAGITLAKNQDYGIDIQTGSYHKIVNNTFLGGTTTDIFRSGGGNNVTIANNLMTNSAGTFSYGIDLSSLANATIFNNTIENAQTYGIRLTTTHSTIIQNNTMTSNTNDLNIRTSSNYTQIIDTIINAYSITDNIYYLSLENTTTGKIFYLSNVSGTGTKLWGTAGADILIKNNSAFVNSSKVSSLNISANITLYGLGWASTPNIYADWNDDATYDEKCVAPTCYNLSYSSGTFIFNTTHFTEYITGTNMAPYASQYFVNSSAGTNYTDENLNCYVNVTDIDGGTLQAYYRWYNNSVMTSITGNASITANIVSLVSTLGAGNTTRNQNWTCEVKANDYTVNETNWHNATLTILNKPATIISFSLNSTGTPTRDYDNLTCWANATDADGDTPINAFYNWYNNSVQIPGLSGNKSITANTLTLISFLGAGNTTKGETWTCEARFYDGYINSSWYNSSARIVEISPVLFINGNYNGLKFNGNNIVLKLNEIT